MLTSLDKELICKNLWIQVEHSFQQNTTKLMLIECLISLRQVTKGHIYISQILCQSVCGFVDWSVLFKTDMSTACLLENKQNN